MQLFYESCCTFVKEDPHLKQLSGDAFNFAAYEAAERSFLTTETLLLACQGAVPQDPDQIDHLKDPYLDQSIMAPREKFKYDQEILVHHILCIGEMLGYEPTAPSEDEFTKMSRQFNHSGEMSLYLLFATDAYLTTHHVLKEKHLAAMADFYLIVDIFAGTLRGHLDFHKSLKVSKWHIEYDKFLEDLLKGEISNWGACSDGALERYRTVSKLLSIASKPRLISEAAWTRQGRS